MRGARERVGRGLGRLLLVMPRVFLRGLRDLIEGLLLLLWALAQQAWEDLVNATPMLLKRTLVRARDMLNNGASDIGRFSHAAGRFALRYVRAASPIAGRALGLTAGTLLILVLTMTPEGVMIALLLLAAAAAIWLWQPLTNWIIGWAFTAVAFVKDHRVVLARVTLIAVAALEMGFVLAPLLLSPDPVVVRMTTNALISYAILSSSFIASAWIWKRVRPLIGAALLAFASILAAGFRRIVRAYVNVGGALINRLRQARRARGHAGNTAHEAPTSANGPRAGEGKSGWSVFKFSFIDLSLVSGSLVGLSFLSLAGLAFTGFEVKASLASETDANGMATLQLSAGWTPESRERMRRFWQTVSSLPEAFDANMSRARAELDAIRRDIEDLLAALSVDTPPDEASAPGPTLVVQILEPRAVGATLPLQWRLGSASLLMAAGEPIGVQALQLSNPCAFDTILVLGQASNDGEAERNAVLSQERARNAANEFFRLTRACPLGSKPAIRAIALGPSLAASADPSQRRLVLLGANQLGDISAVELKAILRARDPELAALIEEHALFCEVSSAPQGEC